MQKRFCKILGVVFVLVGICGFLMPTLLGAHLTPLTPGHSVARVYFGFAGTRRRRARVLSLFSALP